jgi:hydroxypyruvate reductase
MSSLTQLRLAAREIFDETLQAVDAGEAVRRVVSLDQSRLTIQNTTIDLQKRPVYSVAIGKAALAMASALENILGEQLVAGLIVNEKRSHRLVDSTNIPKRISARWQVSEAGHPLPTEASLSAAADAFALLERANNEQAVIIFLISGGGSAMLEWPRQPEITLAHLRRANEVLIKCGASIGEINSVRRMFSAVKGGRLAALAPNCDQITLIVSDVPAGEERNVASGPTVAPPRDAPDALDVFTRYNLTSQLPASIVKTIANREPKNLKSSAMREWFVILDNDRALAAAAQAARRREFIVEMAPEISDQRIEDGCALLLKRLEALRAKNRHTTKVLCLISGGEFACRVGGNGIGGRSLETALRFCCSLSSPDTAALFVGTDGVDGNSPAAGALVDSTTLQRAMSIGLDPNDFVRRSDSYSFFIALGDVVATGPTGTNVRDLRIFLSQP